MPPLVVPGICRFAVHGTNGRPWVNILDMHIQTDVGGSREESIEDQAEIINQQWLSAWDAFCASTWQVTGTSWVDLNSLSGSTGNTSAVQGGPTLPSPGTAVGQALTPNVAYLVKKTAGVGRGRRHGRWYVPGPPELAGNLEGVDATVLGQINAMLPSLLNAINQESAPLSVGSYNSHLSVVHRPGVGDPSYDHVTSLQCDPVFATMRRRLRG